ncbi:MAG: RagB/SusD family nutrient uptake outer membrane protein [Cytophagales bacterium]|nr:RagB/SusD family nutrient uptake outer membrane protein [Cytophagales bacterium]
MKTKFLVTIVVVLILTGCAEDFLNRPPQDALVDASFYQTDDQLLAGTADLYSAVWKDYCDQANWKIGDVRAGVLYSPWATSSDIRDFTTFNVTGLSAANVSAYRAFYQVIGQANTIIHNINLYAGASVTARIKNHTIAEARFMRATAYTYLVLNYGPVPVIEDNTAYLNNPALRRNTVESVWEFIRRDYEFAAENLSETPIQTGRLTKWSAEGMLARTYLTLAGHSGTLNAQHLTKAKEHAERVITMSGKSLLPRYGNLFLWPYDNNNESLFELQWVFTSNNDLRYKHANTMISQITPSNSIAANGDGWGGGVGATGWMLKLYDGLYNPESLLIDSDTAFWSASPGFTLDQRLRETFMLPGFKYPELAAKDDSFLSAGDKAVRFLPNGNNAAPGDGLHFAWIKKYVIGPVAGETAYQNYPNNVYMLRLAEMYLIYAEATVLQNGGTTSDGQALQYFNAVHTRAGLPPFTDPLTWDEIFKERVKEFAMEGMAWYDLARRHYYDAQHVYDLINSQERGQYLVSPEPWPNPTGWNLYDVLWDDETDRVLAGPSNFLMPIPQVELSQAPSLREEPVPYIFD